MVAEEVAFRFHTGSIKRIQTQTQFTYPISFDSILVRLKDSLQITLPVHQEFRFHTGSIKSIDSVERLQDDRGCFDSILVRLKVTYQASQLLHIDHVSIPYWFD